MMVELKWHTEVCTMSADRTQLRNTIVAGFISLMMGATLVGCQSATAPVSDPVESADAGKATLVAAQWVGAAGGSLSMGSYSLEIPANAVQDNTRIEIKQLTMGSWDVELSPHGTQFNVPVTLSMNLEGEANSKNMQVHWWNPDTQQWEAQQTVVDNGVASAQLMHFSRYTIY
jgi:hypothetical protein